MNNPTPLKTIKCQALGPARWGFQIVAHVEDAEGETFDLYYGKRLRDEAKAEAFAAHVAEHGPQDLRFWVGELEGCSGSRDTAELLIMRAQAA